MKRPDRPSRPAPPAPDPDTGTALLADAVRPRTLFISAAEWEQLIAEDPQADPDWPARWLARLALPPPPRPK